MTLLIIYAIGFTLALVVNLHGLTLTRWYWCALFSIFWPIDMVIYWAANRFYEDHTKL